MHNDTRRATGTPTVTMTNANGLLDEYDEERTRSDDGNEAPDSGNGEDAGDAVGDYEGAEASGPVSSDLELARFCEVNGIHDYAALLRARHALTWAAIALCRPARRRAWARREQWQVGRRAVGGDPGDPERQRQVASERASCSTWRTA